MMKNHWSSLEKKKLKYGCRKSKKISQKWDFYTQVISRILYLDMYLSGMIFTYHLKHLPSTEAEPTSLHNLGFTRIHQSPEVLSARKRTAETFHLELCTVFFSREVHNLFGLCGTGRKK